MQQRRNDQGLKSKMSASRGSIEAEPAGATIAFQAPVFTTGATIQFYRNLFYKTQSLQIL